MRHLWTGHEWDYKKNEEGTAETKIMSDTWWPGSHDCVNSNQNASLTVSAFSFLKEELEFQDVRDLIWAHFHFSLADISYLSLQCLLESNYFWRLSWVVLSRAFQLVSIKISFCMRKLLVFGILLQSMISLTPVVRFGSAQVDSPGNRSPGGNAAPPRIQPRRGVGQRVCAGDTVRAGVWRGSQTQAG